MKEEDKEIQQLYIMDVKTLEMFKVNVDEIDECKFALFVFNKRNCCFWLKGANIQTLAYSGKYSSPQYIVSKDIKSLCWIKESFQWLIGDIGFKLKDAWDKIYDEKFDSYKKLR